VAVAAAGRQNAHWLAEEFAGWTERIVPSMDGTSCVGSG
jgi:hypothetical protein